MFPWLIVGDSAGIFNTSWAGKLPPLLLAAAGAADSAAAGAAAAGAADELGLASAQQKGAAQAALAPRIHQDPTLVASRHAQPQLIQSNSVCKQAMHEVHAAMKCKSYHVPSCISMYHNQA